MKLLITSITVLFNLHVFGQQSDNLERNLLAKFLAEPRITRNIEKSLEKQNFDLVLEDGTNIYSNSRENSPTVVQLKKVKNLGNGYYKIKVFIDEDLLITTKLWYSECASKLFIKNLYIREANWLVGKGKFYVWEFQS